MNFSDFYENETVRLGDAEKDFIKQKNDGKISQRELDDYLEELMEQRLQLSANRKKDKEIERQIIPIKEKQKVREEQLAALKVELLAAEKGNCSATVNGDPHYVSF